jgi:hypothetical protein
MTALAKQRGLNTSTLQQQLRHQRKLQPKYLLLNQKLQAHNFL